jgi:hypothetical protein
VSIQTSLPYGRTDAVHRVRLALVGCTFGCTRPPPPPPPPRRRRFQPLILRKKLWSGYPCCGPKIALAAVWKTQHFWPAAQIGCLRDDIDIAAFFATVRCDPRPSTRKTLATATNLGALIVAMELSSPDRTLVETDRPAVDPRQRSRLANGSALLPGHVDGRSAWCRRAKEVIAAHLSDTPDPSVAERSLIRRAAALTVELERLEAKFALTAGHADIVDLEVYQRCANSLRRLLETIHSGLQRRAKQINELTLDEIASEIAASKSEDAVS